MKKRKTSLLAFGAICAITPFVVRTVTVIDVTAASTEEVQVHGWTQMDEASPRVGLEGRTSPFRLVMKGADMRAHFTAQGDGEMFEVRAARKRAWLPLIRVGGEGSTISLESTNSNLRMTAQ